MVCVLDFRREMGLWHGILAVSKVYTSKACNAYQCGVGGGESIASYYALSKGSVTNECIFLF